MYSSHHHILSTVAGLLLMGHFGRGRRQTTDELDGRKQGRSHGGGALGVAAQTFRTLPQLGEHVAGVRVAARGVPHAEEVVVHEGGKQSRAAQENHDDDERHEEDLPEGNESEDGVGLELHQRDAEAGSPPVVLTQGVQNGERVRAEVDEREEKDGQEGERDGRDVEEDEREPEVVKGVLEHEEVEKLLGEGEGGDALVEAKRGDGGVRDQHLVVRVDGVTNNWNEVDHGEEKSRSTGSPQGYVYLVSNGMFFECVDRGLWGLGVCHLVTGNLVYTDVKVEFGSTCCPLDSIPT